MIMLFGEIDCREGLLLAVQKCKVCACFGVDAQGRLCVEVHVLE